MTVAAEQIARASAGAAPAPGRYIETDIPARLDRLPWSRFHLLVIVALGVTWVLDGLEVTLAGAVAGAMQRSPHLHFTNAEIGLSGSAYLTGNVLGAVLFGWLTDRLGRKRLFSVTLGLYLLATLATAFSWNFGSYALFRFLTGAGIGGEYTAINSAIQELIPARYRGRTDIVINGSFWMGAALGAGGSILLLDPDFLALDTGWRLAFGIGAGLGLVILFLRGYIPESPRWLLTHGMFGAAEATVAEIERRIERAAGLTLGPAEGRLRIHAHHRTSLAAVARCLLKTYPRRSTLGFALMAAQAFFYNAIFFTYALILTHFYGVPAGHVGWYLVPFSLGNFLGPLFLGHLFDTIGRRPMITFTYALSGLLLALTGGLFAAGLLDARTQTFAWTVIFFFASAAASSAYLTVSESFPLEIRAFAIALFYALGTAVGGVFAPALFGLLIDSGSAETIFGGYLLGALLMVGAAVVAFRIGIRAERRPLEALAAPLSSLPPVPGE